MVRFLCAGAGATVTGEANGTEGVDELRTANTSFHSMLTQTREIDEILAEQTHCPPG